MNSPAINSPRDQRWAMFAQAARGPVLLITLGTLFALQQAGTLSISRSWPLLIIVIGVMKLLERVLLGPAPYVPPAGVPTPGYAPGYTPGHAQNYGSTAPPRTQPPAGAGYSGPSPSGPPPAGGPTR